MLDGNIVGTALSAIPTFALLIVYMTFAISSTSTQDTGSFALKLLPSFGTLGPLEDVLASGKLSIKVVTLLGIVLLGQIWSFGYPAGISFTTALFSGLARAGSWYFTICTIQGRGSGDEDLEKNRDHDHRLSHSGPRSEPSWTLATLISTFCLVSSRDPSIQSSNLQALSQVVASLVVLGQIIYTLPRQAKAKSILWVFALVAVVPYLYHGFALGQLNSTAPSWTPLKPHPADLLVQRATADFDKMLKRQSKTYDDAVREYKRRYGIDPPLGFDNWYELAVANDSPIIDEFDTIFENIAPFLKLSGQEINSIIKKVRGIPNVELWDCAFTSNDDKAMTQCVHFSRRYDRHISTMFDRMLRDLEGLKVPSVRFFVNHFDEPRVVFPAPHEDPRVTVEMMDLSRQPTWDRLTQPCGDHGYINKTYHFSPPRFTDVNTYSLPFVTDRQADLDICQHPSYQPLNGLFVSPVSFKLISGLVPVLSTGAPSTMGDILIPSPAYSESGFQYHPEADIPWSKKYNNLYWAGSTTGGFASDQHAWPLFQRQRFVAKMQNPNSSRHSFLYQIPGSEEITTSQTNLLNPSHYDVSFTNIFQCLPAQCRSQRKFFRLKSWSKSNTPLHSKLTFDLDGNGISGRYYKLLSSNSLPLKQTLLREWHDDRLWPWVHYIPVSQELEELPELVRFLLGTKRGEEIAEDLAKRGREWMRKGMREVDRSLYLYRVLLELGRVQDVTREAWDP
ncbi:beta-1,2-xylosyltransferase 1 [Naviculisporaceae sp. PSN 640]